MDTNFQVIPLMLNCLMYDLFLLSKKAVLVDNKGVEINFETKL